MPSSRAAGLIEIALQADFSTAFAGFVYSRFVLARVRLGRLIRVNRNSLI